MLINLETEQDSQDKVIITQELTPVDIFQEGKFSLKQFCKGFWSNTRWVRKSSLIQAVPQCSIGDSFSGHFVELV